MERFDVVVLGAGAAGLAAARALCEQGRSVAILEARDRIGGRIYTLRSSNDDLPIELGAEFVHGMPPETFAIAHAARLPLVELGGASFVSAGGYPQAVHDDEAGGADEDGRETILRAMREWNGPDCTFQAFLDERFSGNRWVEARRAASGYVEGFDAADVARVSVRWLGQTEVALAAIHGNRQFRLPGGYDQVVAWLRAGLAPEQTSLRLNTIAHEIRWSRGEIEVALRSPFGAALESVAAHACILTLPIGVLAAPPEAPGAVRFIPEAPERQQALQRIEMGQVVKVLLRFREAFWEEAASASDHLPALPQLSFLLSDDPVLPTWWTAFPLLSPVLTGWVGGPRAARLAHLPEAEIAEQAVEALARVLGLRRAQVEARLENWKTHNWSADHYARGAYSYLCAGGLDAPAALGAPVEETLFFAGEATNSAGHTGTVHGAIATGLRAAREVGEALARRE